MQNPSIKDVGQTGGSGPSSSTNQPNYFGTMAVVMAAMLAVQDELTDLRKGETEVMVDTANAKLAATLAVGKATIDAGTAAANLVEQDKNMQIGAAVTSGISAGVGIVGVGSSFQVQKPVKNMEDLLEHANPHLASGAVRAVAGDSSDPVTTPMTPEKIALLKKTREEISDGRFSLEKFSTLHEEIKTQKSKNKDYNVGAVVVARDDNGNAVTLSDLANSCTSEKELTKFKNGFKNSRALAKEGYDHMINAISTAVSAANSISQASNAGVAANADTLKAKEEANRAQAQMESQLAQDGGAQDDKAAQSQASLYQQAIDAQKQLFSQESQMGQAIASR